MGTVKPLIKKGIKSPLLRQKVEDRLRRIANVLLLNGSFIDNLGLLKGKNHYSRYTQNKIFEDYAGELMDEICGSISNNIPVDFENRLTGIGWGIEYLVKNRFVEADTDEALEDMDNVIYRSLQSNPLLIESENDFFGYGHYCLSRLQRYENDDNLKTLIKKKHFIYLIDNCECLLAHKRHLDFNIPQLSVNTICSFLWFLLEIDRLGLFPSKVKKVLNYLPDYISKVPTNNKADLFILLELTKSAAFRLPGTDFHEKYDSLSQLYKEMLKKEENLPDKVLAGMRSVNIQKLFYGTYIGIDFLNSESNEQAYSIIENEESWNQTLDGINKYNLGLTGIAGTGLILQHIVDNTINAELIDWILFFFLYDKNELVVFYIHFFVGPPLLPLISIF